MDRRTPTTDGGLVFRSASLFHSLIIAIVVGVLVASVGIALFALSRYLQTPWHIAAATGGIGQVVIVAVLLMIVLEQRRRRSIRQRQGFTFLNHHIRNAITQMTMIESHNFSESFQSDCCAFFDGESDIVTWIRRGRRRGLRSTWGRGISSRRVQSAREWREEPEQREELEQWEEEPEQRQLERFVRNSAPEKL